MNRGFLSLSRLLLCLALAHLPLLPGPVVGQSNPETAGLPAPLILIGGALHTCTSQDTENCKPGTTFTDNSETELVSVSDNRLAGSNRILDRLFTASAMVSGAERPTLVLITASSGNPFGSVDFYTQVFQQTGFSVYWLPVDAALARLLDQGLPCDQLAEVRRTQFDGRASVQDYPGLHAEQKAFCENPQPALALLETADAVFFNGGDQSLTLQAMLLANGEDRPWMQSIRRRHAAGQLVIAGTSAGTAVQSNNEMLMGGDSSGAINSGVQQGNAHAGPIPDDRITGVMVHRRGTALFPLGILDSHFSERGRWLRLQHVLMTSGARFGFGVDETTALVVNWVNADRIQLDVVGEAGVVILEKNENPQSDSLLIHTLMEGNSLAFRDLKPVWPETPAIGNNGNTESYTLGPNEFLEDGMRTRIQRVLRASNPPALIRYITGPDAVSTTEYELDFTGLRPLPGPESATYNGFHSLVLRWR